MEYMDIRFPNLGIVFSHVGRYISVGGFHIMFYGIIIAAGFLVGLLIAQKEAKRTGQNPEMYLDYLICMMIPAIVGARAYYVIFSWDYYKEHPLDIINIPAWYPLLMLQSPAPLRTSAAASAGSVATWFHYSVSDALHRLFRQNPSSLPLQAPDQPTAD